MPEKLYLRAGAALTFFLAAIQPALPATIVGLGNLGGGDATVTGVNNAGQIVGYAHTSTSVLPHAFLYSGGSMHDLGTLGGDSSFATGINNSGQISGYSTTDASGNTVHAFLYSAAGGGAMQDLGTLGDSSVSSFALGINDAGTVVGYSYLLSSSLQSDAFAYSPAGGGHMTDIGVRTDADAINNNGLIAEYAPSGFFKHATLYNNGIKTDLGTVGGDYSTPAAINDNGQVAGSSQYDTAITDYHAFLYDPNHGGMVDLGTLGGMDSGARAIDASGNVLGIAQTATNYTPFLYSGGVMTDLNTLLPANSGWQLLDANGFTGTGQIVGTGIYNGQEGVYLLDLNAPEPGSVSLLGAGVAALLISRRRRA